MSVRALCVAFVMSASLLCAGVRADDGAQAAPTTTSATGLTTSVLLEGAVFVPDPIQAPPNRQLELGLTVARADGLFLRLRAGGALRSLGADVLGSVEGGIGGTTEWGLTGDVAVGVGGRQQFTAGDLYAAGDDGRIARVTDFGTSLLLLGVQAGVGFDVGHLTGLPLRALVVPRVQLSLPQRDQAAVELGVGLRLQWAQ
jgi:hypothetical protein